jgi:hypothetical protein
MTFAMREFVPDMYQTENVETKIEVQLTNCPVAQQV